jgi:alanyl-tRNA synthetase
MPAAIERLQEDLKERRRAQAVLQTELAHYKAEELIAGAETIAGGRLVVRSVDLDATGLKTLASAITAGAGFTVALASAGRPALIVIARSKDGTVRANEVIAALTARFGGRGGGKPDLAQAGGLDASIEELLAEARRLVSA